MTMSVYPYGFADGVSIRGLPVVNTHAGRVYYVNNSSVLPLNGVGGSNSNDGSYLKPFSTIAYAVSKCTAGRGDVVMVMPGHVETVSTAAGLDLNVAGVSVVGLGNGSSRATVNLTATAAYVALSAANCSLVNVLITGGIDAVVKAVSVSAADCVISRCEVRDVTGQMTDGVVTTAAANRLKILNHVHDGAAAAGTNAAIALVGGDRIEITVNYMVGNFAVGGIDVRTTATTNLAVHDVVVFRTVNAADIFLIDTITASTGQIGPNINIRLQDNAANITEAITGATFVVMDPVYVCNLAGEKAMLINWTASTDA